MVLEFGGAHKIPWRSKRSPGDIDRLNKKATGAEREAKQKTEIPDTSLPDSRSIVSEQSGAKNEAILNQMSQDELFDFPEKNE